MGDLRGFGLGPVGSSCFQSARLNFYVILLLGEVIPVLRKKRGRPATGQDPVLALRLPPALRSAIENWAKRQSDKPSRSEAIRRLLEFALAIKSKKRNSDASNRTAISGTQRET
jgi:hypothetical protein